jgi:hypothetical protein
MLANDASTIELDVLALGSIDATIYDSQTEMILVPRKTPVSKITISIKMLIQAGVLKGEVDGWKHTHH